MSAAVRAWALTWPPPYDKAATLRWLEAAPEGACIDSTSTMGSRLEVAIKHDGLWEIARGSGKEPERIPLTVEDKPQTGLWGRWGGWFDTTPDIRVHRGVYLARHECLQALNGDQDSEARRLAFVEHLRKSCTDLRPETRKLMTPLFNGLLAMLDPWFRAGFDTLTVREIICTLGAGAEFWWTPDQIAEGRARLRLKVMAEEAPAEKGPEE